MKIPLVPFNYQSIAIKGIEVISLESIKKRSSELNHDPESPHRVKFHMLLYIQEGNGEHFIDFLHHSFSAGSFVFINENQIHAFDFTNNPSGFVIIFPQEFKDSLRLNIRLPQFFMDYTFLRQVPVLDVIGPLKQSAESLINEMGLVFGDEDHDLTIVQLLFSVLMLKLYRQMPSIISSTLSERQTSRFLYFLSLISQNYIQIKDASKYADLMGMTYKSLNQLCRLAVDQTPKQLIDVHIILEAKRRLAIESIQVNELSYALGFDEVSNFTKYFKKHVLMTPKQFRENVKG